MNQTEDLAGFSAANFFSVILNLRGVIRDCADFHLAVRNTKQSRTRPSVQETGPDLPARMCSIRERET